MLVSLLIMSVVLWMAVVCSVWILLNLDIKFLTVTAKWIIMSSLSEYAPRCEEKILELSWFYSQHHYIVNQKDFVRDLLSFASLTILLEIITAIFCMINTSKKYKISMASFIIFGFLEELY